MHHQHKQHKKDTPKNKVSYTHTRVLTTHTNKTRQFWGAVQYKLAKNNLNLQTHTIK